MEEIEMKETAPANLDDVFNMDDIEIERFADNRGYNLQLIAAETGHVNAVKNLINRGFEFDSEVDGHTAVELAFQNKHYGVVLNLLQANSRFPTNYDSEVAPDDLKEFALISNELHESIRDENEEKIEQIFENNPSLRHFYNLENKSAIRVALEDKKISIYKILISHKIYIGPHEEIDEIVQKLTRKERRTLREIHANMATSVFSKQMMTLCKNSFIGPDIPDHVQNLNFINEAFHFLLQIPQVAIILKIVAASRKFKIIFDFKRDSLTYLDPTAEPYTNGLFYTSRKIFIAAKNLLDPDRKFEVYSVIAHELAHFAFFLVYENSAKPFHTKNEDAKIIFEKAIELCKNTNFELIKAMFDCYPETMYPAELIVRAPQILVLFHNDEKLLESIKNEFEPLFEFYENCTTEMEKALPRIKAKNLSKNQKKIKKQRKIIFRLSSVLAFFMMLSIPLGFWLYSLQTLLTWQDLKEDQKIIFQNSKVSFHEIEVKFRDLFANSSEVYENLNSNEISKALEGDTELLSKNIKNLYDKFIFLTWENMTSSLRRKLLTSNVIFQGQNVKFNEILTKSCSAFKILTAKQIKDHFNGNLIHISSELKSKNKFYVERFFTNEDNELSKNETFVLFDDSEIIDFNKIVRNMWKTRTFLLSSLAGEGKSTAYKQFWFKLKEKFPFKWVEFVDLKKHFDAYKIGNKSDLTSSEKLSNFFSDHLLKLNELEKEIFAESFESGNTFFLTDGIDEISPYFTDFMLQLVENVQNHTRNFQFLSTRPQHSQKYQEVLKTEAYKLVPLRKFERLEFLIKSIASETLHLTITTNISSNITELEYLVNNTESFAKFKEIFDRGQKILESIENSTSSNDFITNPLLIRMIAEIVTDGDDESDIQENLNFYKLYEIFIKKKIMQVDEKGKLGKETRARLDAKALSMMKLHFAMILKTYEHHFDIEISNLKISKDLAKVPHEDINRYGIINIISDEDVESIHKTFIEFFIAHYLVNNIEKIEDNDDEGKFCLELFNFVWFRSLRSSIEKQFVKSYVNQEEKLLPILEFIRDEDSSFLDELSNITNNEKILTLLSFVNFADYLEKNYKISLDRNPYPRDLNLGSWNSTDFDDFIQKWDDIQKILGIKKFTKIFEIKRSRVGSILHEWATVSDLNYKIFEKMNETFGKKFVKKTMEVEGQLNLTYPVLIIATQNLTEVKEFWSFYENISSLEETKLFLSKTFDSALTSLQLSAINADKDVFLFVKNLYETFFTKEEIQRSLLGLDNSTLNFVTFIIWQHHKSNETMIAVADYLLELFSDHKLQLRKLLSHRNSDGDTLYSLHNVEKNKNIQILIDLLNKTFEHDQEDFKTLLEELQETQYLEIYFKNQTNIDLINNSSVRDISIGFAEFRYLIKNWEKIQNLIGAETFKLFLLSQSSDNKTILFDLIRGDVDDWVIEPFLNKLKKTLCESEIKTLIMIDLSLLSFAVLSSESLTLVEAIYNFLQEHLGKDQFKLFLLYKNWQNDTPLRTAATKSLEKFSFMKESYEKYFTIDQIQKMFLKRKGESSFIQNMLSRDSKAFKEVANYLKELFKNEREKLKKLISFVKIEEINENFEEFQKLEKFANEKDNSLKSNMFLRIG